MPCTSSVDHMLGDHVMAQGSSSVDPSLNEVILGIMPGGPPDEKESPSDAEREFPDEAASHCNMKKGCFIAMKRWQSPFFDSQLVGGRVEATDQPPEPKQ